MQLDVLRTLVTGAIWKAQELEAMGLPTESAWLEVSRIQERLLETLPLSSAEGRVARRGALRSALKAGDTVRAAQLAERLFEEARQDPAMTADLLEIQQKALAQLQERFPHAAQRTSIAAVQVFARRNLALGSFGLAEAKAA
jgi:hypothetical protein